MKIIYGFIPLILILSFLYSFFGRNSKVDITTLSLSFYDYTANSIDGSAIPMEEYKGKKVLIVNVASKCGYTPQYKELQDLYETYPNDLVILGFPANDFLWQEPENNDTIKQFCKNTYGVTFPMFEKTSVKKSQEQHSLYTWLSDKQLNGWNDVAPSWNFCKYLIDENGILVDFFPSKIKPFDPQLTKYFKTDSK